MGVDPETGANIGETKDVIISWARAPIPADYSNIEPNEYIPAGATSGLSLGLGSSLLALLAT